VILNNSAISLTAQAYPGDLVARSFNSFDQYPSYNQLNQFNQPSSQTSIQTQTSQETETFVASWKSLSQQFSQTQNDFEQQTSVAVAYQSVQTLIRTYRSTVSSYQACGGTNSLAQAGFQVRLHLSFFDLYSFTCWLNVSLAWPCPQNQFQQSVTEMFTSYQSIVVTYKRTYSNTQYSSYFSCKFLNLDQLLNGSTRPDARKKKHSGIPRDELVWKLLPKHLFWPPR
jgi:hypothetical protein